MGKSGEVKIDFLADISDAVRGHAELIRLEQEFDETLKNVARDAGKAGNAVKDGMTRGKGHTKAVKEEMGALATATQSAAHQAANWIKGFVGIAGIVRSVRAVSDELKEQLRLQQEMLGSAVNIDRMSQGLAALKKGGLTPANIAAARKEIENLAMQTSTDMETARQGLFFGYSAYGDTAAGRAAALTTTKVAATGQLKPEVIASLPGLFKVLGANTEDQQMDAVNKLVTATKGSIAETGPYIPAFVTAYPTLKAAGFGYDESLAMMNASVTASAGNVPEAATRMQSAVKYTAYPSNEAEKFLTAEAKKRGLNFATMQPKDRLFFTRDVYQQSLRDKTMTQFGSAFGTKAMQGFGGLFTEESQAEYERAMGIVGGADMGMVQADFAGYQGSLPARQTQEEVERQIVEAGTGREKEYPARFNTLVENIRKQVKASGTKRERADLIGQKIFGLGMWGDDLQSNTIAFNLSQMGLKKELLSIEEGGVTESERQRYNRIQNLFQNKPLSYSLNQDYVAQVWEETGGFENLRDGFLAVDKTAANQANYYKSIGRYFEALGKKLEENTAALNRINTSGANILVE